MLVDASDAKLDAIVSDTSKFEEINFESESTHHIIAKERSIMYYIRKYLKECGEETVKNLIPSASTQYMGNYTN